MASSTVAASTPPTEASPARSRGYRRAIAVAAAALAAHIAVNLWGPYQLHRDALLYLAMGEHLSLFRMDFPPLIALVAEGTRTLLGESRVAIRMGPALAHVALILLAASLSRRVGGGGRAQLLTALIVATAPVYLRAGSLFQPVVFDQLWWMLSLYALVRISQATMPSATSPPLPRSSPSPTPAAVALPGSPRRWWLLLGVALGLGLLTKFTILVLGGAILVALLATPLRQWLTTPWPWLAAGLGLLIGSPSLIGQVALGWPFFNQFQDLQAVQLDRITPSAFAAEQLLMVGPAVLFGVVAAVTLLVTRRHRPLRPLGWATAAAFLLMMLAGGKAYYIAPIWPALLAVGTADAERWLDRVRARHRTAATAGWALLTGVVVGFGVIALPMGLPFLPPEPMARYAGALGVTEAVTTNRGVVLELPQDYADTWAGRRWPLR